MSIVQVVTRGFGTFGDIAHVVTGGFDVGDVLVLKIPLDRTADSAAQIRMIAAPLGMRETTGPVAVVSVTGNSENRNVSNLNEGRTVLSIN